MSTRILVTFAALILAAVLVCPKPRGATEVDPVECFRRCFDQASCAEAGEALGREATSERRDRLHRMRGLVERNYSFSVSGEDTVAGRKTWVLAIRPRVKKRPWRQLWIDCSTYEVVALRDWNGTNKLRRSVRGLQGLSNALEQADPYSMPPKAVTKPRSPEEPRQLAGTNTSARIPSYVPHGFEMLEVRKPATGGWSQVVYTDGLYAIGLFDRFRPRPSGEHRRTTAVYDWGGGLLLSTSRAGREVVVLADLPVDELERMAGSLRKPAGADASVRGSRNVQPQASSLEPPRRGSSSDRSR